MSKRIVGKTGRLTEYLVTYGVHVQKIKCFPAMCQKTVDDTPPARPAPPPLQKGTYLHNHTE